MWLHFPFFLHLTCFQTEALRLVSHKVAYKLYRSSYNRGARLFYPPNFLLLDYVLKQAAHLGIEDTKEIVIQKTRQELFEECGITVKTINRTIGKLKDDGVISIKKAACYKSPLRHKPMRSASTDC